MVPLKAPLPTARYFPFQFAAGIQSSILMSESLEGRSVAATRQNAGSARGRSASVPGGVNGPAGRASASVIAVFGSASIATSAQEPAAARAGTGRTAASRTTHSPPRRILITAPPCALQRAGECYLRSAPLSVLFRDAIEEADHSGIERVFGPDDEEPILLDE